MDNKIRVSVEEPVQLVGTEVQLDLLVVGTEEELDRLVVGTEEELDHLVVGTEEELDLLVGTEADQAVCILAAGLEAIPAQTEGVQADPGLSRA